MAVLPSITSRQLAVTPASPATQNRIILVPIKLDLIVKANSISIHELVREQTGYDFSFEEFR